MSTTPVEPPRNFAALRTHAVDRVSSMLMALVIVVGLAVLVMGAIFLSRLDLASPDAILLEPEDEQAAGRGDNAAGFARDFAPPGQEEVEELNEPSLEQTLEAVTDAVTSVAASLDTVESSAIDASQGSGKGDSRPPGPMGEGSNIISRAERWELKFTARNIKAYASQLDFFNMNWAPSEATSLKSTMCRDCPASRLVAKVKATPKSDSISCGDKTVHCNSMMHN